LPGYFDWSESYTANVGCSSNDAHLKSFRVLDQAPYGPQNCFQLFGRTRMMIPLCQKRISSAFTARPSLAVTLRCFDSPRAAAHASRQDETVRIISLRSLEMWHCRSSVLRYRSMADLPIPSVVSGLPLLLSADLASLNRIVLKGTGIIVPEA
jgi:hypothetical protein